MAIDSVDRKILNLLQGDGRISNAELAERIHLSPSACHRRVKQLEESGLVDGYVMIVDQESAGRPTNVFVEVTLKGQSDESLDAFERAVLDCPEIMECYLMAGQADYLLRLAVADIADYERVHRQYLSRFPGVDRLRSIFTMRTVCKKTAIEF
jgi:Lrp/AsnC family leucine-responsive transcriptional regulator